MLTESEAEDNYLGQFIPLQYHHNMLMDNNRMSSFKAAIEHVVFPCARVLELGGGTGVLSWFAAAKAEKVWCVEFNPELVAESRKFLAANANGHKVEVVRADAFSYLPPEPVDVVICEMIHVAMLREKQFQVLESFKQRYLQRFGGPLPILIPTAVVMAVQPLQKEFMFHGFHAPIVQVEELLVSTPGIVEMARPAVYAIFDYTQPTPFDIAWQGTVDVEQGGTVNAMRFVTKNVLAVQAEYGTSIDWLNRYMSFPLNTPVKVKKGDRLSIRFHYRAGDLISALQSVLHAEVMPAEG